MRTINLVDKRTSDIKYEVLSFPDGQQNIVIKDEELGGNFNDLKTIQSGPLTSIYIDSHFNKNYNTVLIKSRLNNWKDLELIVCTVACLRELCSGLRIHLYVPYIMGARSDRKFEEGGNNYLKDVICPIINSLNFKTVTCIDPHSYSLECCIKNFRSIDNSQLVKFALNQIYNEK